MFKYKSINKIITAIKKIYIKILFFWKLTICEHFYYLKNIRQISIMVLLPNKL